MIGIRERPVAADMDQDGVDDLGLWVPDRVGVTDADQSEWYFLISDGDSLLARLSPPDDPLDSWPVIDFTPHPFGPDLYARFGDEFAVPVVGNFDPPTVLLNLDVEDVEWTNGDNALDVNNDDSVSPLDALFILNDLNLRGARPLASRGHDEPYLDVNADRHVSPLDALLVVNELNRLNVVRSLTRAPVAARSVVSLAGAALADQVFVGNDNPLLSQSDDQPSVSFGSSTLPPPPSKLLLPPTDETAHDRDILIDELTSQFDQSHALDESDLLMEIVMNRLAL